VCMCAHVCVRHTHTHMMASQGGGIREREIKKILRYTHTSVNEREREKGERTREREKVEWRTQGARFTRRAGRAERVPRAGADSQTQHAPLLRLCPLLEHRRATAGWRRSICRHKTLDSVKACGMAWTPESSRHAWSAGRSSKTTAKLAGCLKKG